MDQIGWIRRLKGRENSSEREIARITGLSRNTAAKWLRAEVLVPKYRRPAVSCKLTPFEEQLTQALKAELRTARRPFIELQAAGYRGCYSRLTGSIRAWRLQEGHQGRAAANRR